MAQEQSRQSAFFNHDAARVSRSAAQRAILGGSGNQKRGADQPRKANEDPHGIVRPYDIIRQPLFLSFVADLRVNLSGKGFVADAHKARLVVPFLQKVPHFRSINVHQLIDLNLKFVSSDDVQKRLHRVCALCCWCGVWSNQTDGAWQTLVRSRLPNQLHSRHSQTRRNNTVNAVKQGTTRQRRYRKMSNS